MLFFFEPSHKLNIQSSKHFSPQFCTAVYPTSAIPLFLKPPSSSKAQWPTGSVTTRRVSFAPRVNGSTHYALRGRTKFSTVRRRYGPTIEVVVTDTRVKQQLPKKSSCRMQKGHIATMNEGLNQGLREWQALGLLVG